MVMLPIYNIIVLPGSKLWLQTSIYKEFSGKEPVSGERIAFLAQKEEKPKNELTEENFQPIGLMGVISEISNFTPLRVLSALILDDLKDVADEVKRTLKIIPVAAVEEVLRELGIPVKRNPSF